MRCHLRGGCAAGFLVAVLMAVPAAAKDSPAQQMSDRLPKLCAELQKQGWGVSPDQLKLDPHAKAEMRMGKRFYMCTIERQLAGKGPGRAPALGALLASASSGPKVLFSVSVWCAADRESGLEALAKEVERFLTGSNLSVPAELLEAVRASRTYDSTAQGFRYRAEPVEVDAGACDRVQPGRLGPVLMKMDVAVEAKP
jgi:hypothetical protein